MDELLKIRRKNGRSVLEKIMEAVLLILISYFLMMPSSIAPD